MFASTIFGVDTLRDRSRMCDGSLIPSWLSHGQYIFMTIVGLLSVAIYAKMYFVYRRAVRQVAPGSTNNRQVQTQQRLTVTLGIIVVCTLFFFILPTTVTLITRWMKLPLPILFYQALGTVTRFSTVLNIGVYIIRQKEIRAAMWSVLRCRQVNVAQTATNATKQFAAELQKIARTNHILGQI